VRSELAYGAGEAAWRRREHLPRSMTAWHAAGAGNNKSTAAGSSIEESGKKKKKTIQSIK